MLLIFGGGHFKTTLAGVPRFLTASFCAQRSVVAESIYFRVINGAIAIDLWILRLHVVSRRMTCFLIMCKAGSTFFFTVSFCVQRSVVAESIYFRVINGAIAIDLWILRLHVVARRMTCFLIMCKAGSTFFFTVSFCAQRSAVAESMYFRVINGAIIIDLWILRLHVVSRRMTYVLILCKMGNTSIFEPLIAIAI
jgi:hypothetical protein